MQDRLIEQNEENEAYQLCVWMRKSCELRSNKLYK